jgi:hypothetical protein
MTQPLSNRPFISHSQISCFFKVTNKQVSDIAKDGKRYREVFFFWVGGGFGVWGLIVMIIWCLGR